MKSSLLRRLRGSSGLDSILSLFRNEFADVGFYLPLNDRTYMWQEHTGETPVMEQGDTVGLILDKSQGVRVVESLGSELASNDFTTYTVGGGTEWVGSVGSATVTAGDGSDIIYKSIPSLENGKTYQVQFELYGMSSGSIYPNFFGGGTGQAKGSNGFYTQYITFSGGANKNFGFACVGTTTGSVRNVSVREVNRTLTGLGDELVTNGGFDTDSDWTLGANTSISGGELVVSSVGAGFTSQSTSATVGKFYFCTMDVSATTGTVQINLGGTSSSAVSTGTHTFILQMGASHSQLRIAPQGGFTGTIDNISVKEVPGNHAYQNTAASRPIWNATEEGVDFDGTDDQLLMSGVTGLTSTSSFIGVFETADIRFIPLSTSSETNFILASNSGSNNPTSIDGAAETYIDGVKIYNASQKDVSNFFSEAAGARCILEVRDADLSDSAWQSLLLSDYSLGTFDLDGISANYVLTSNTNTTALDAARAQVASAEGITLRHTETLTDQVDTGGVYGPSNDTRLMFQETDGDPIVKNDGDAVGLVINPAEGLSASESLGDELVQQFSASDWAAAGNNTVEDEGGAVKITYVDTSTAATIADLSTGVLPISIGGDGKHYTFEFEAKISTGSATIRADDSLNDVSISSSEYQTYTVTATFSSGAVYLQARSMGAGQVLYIRNISVKEVTRTFSGLGSEIWDPNSVNVTVDDFGGSSGSWDANTLTFTNSSTGSSDSYPRLRMQNSVTSGKWYWTTLSFTGSPSLIRNYDVGGDLLVTENTITAIQRADSSNIELKFDGTQGVFSISDVQLSVKEIPGAHLYQTTAAARPLYDEASGLYDFDGTDDHFLADLTGISGRTNMYVACVVENTDNAAVLFAGSGPGPDLFAWSSSDAVTAAQNAGPGGSLYVDGTLQTGLTRAGLYAIVADGDRHLIEVVGCTLAIANYNTINIGRFGSGSFVYDGLLGDILIIPNPGVVGRNIIRRDILARHPSITFAGA